MKDIEIKISKETRKIIEISKLVIGNDGENLQGNLKFFFSDAFVKGQARLEYVLDDIEDEKNKKYQLLTQENETYTIPIKSVLTKQGKLFMQLVITEGTDEEEIPVFKSNVFFVKIKESINAEVEQPDEYPIWIEIANTKLNQIDNLDISAIKTDGVTTITITKKDGTQESIEIYDGDGGGSGTTVPAHVKNIKEEDITNWNNKSNFDGNYENLSNKPTLFSGSYNDLIDKPTIPTKTSELTNDSGFLTEHQDLSNYATKEFVNDQIESAIGTVLGGSY